MYGSLFFANYHAHFHVDLMIFYRTIQPKSSFLHLITIHCRGRRAHYYFKWCLLQKATALAQRERLLRGRSRHYHYCKGYQRWTDRRDNATKCYQGQKTGGSGS
jgi:hypothetical protein